MVAKAALDVFNRHTWYLQEQTVPFALFSDKLSMDDKSQIAARILTHEARKPVHWDLELQLGQEHHKLTKPNLNIELTSSTTLPDLLGTNSFMLWNILGLGVADAEP